MSNKKIVVAITLLLLGFACSLQSESDSTPKGIAVSGEVVRGYRVLRLEPDGSRADLRVYRGDYIKFNIDGPVDDALLEIPALGVKQTISNSMIQTPYFKMKSTGSFPFSLGVIAGVIEVIEYEQPNYQEMGPKAAAELIDTEGPLILDVRTPSEYKGGHLENAVLIPVQALRRRLGEIGKYKHSTILVYCATGNRSTVGSKILIDEGFKRVVNLRHGIHRWALMKYPVVR